MAPGGGRACRVIPLLKFMFRHQLITEGLFILNSGNETESKDGARRTQQVPARERITSTTKYTCVAALASRHHHQAGHRHTNRSGCRGTSTSTQTYQEHLRDYAKLYGFSRFKWTIKRRECVVRSYKPQASIPLVGTSITCHA